MVMSMVTRRELTNIVCVRYARADRSLKGRILDEFVATTGYCRKYAICLLGKPPQAAPPKRRRLRQRVHSSSLMEPLAVIWETCNHICGKRLKPFLAEIIGRLEHFNHLHLSERDRQLLAQMSVSTSDRLLMTACSRNSAMPGGLMVTVPPNRSLTSSRPSRSAPSGLSPGRIPVTWSWIWSPIVVRPSVATMCTRATTCAH